MAAPPVFTANYAKIDSPTYSRLIERCFATRLLETTEQQLNSSIHPGTFSVRAVYAELNDTLAAIDEQEDLRWWRNRHGPGMPTDWPHFQVGRHRSRPWGRGSRPVLFSVKEWKPEKKTKKGKKVVENKGTIEKR